MTTNPNLALRRQWLDDTADGLTALPFHEYEKITELRGVYKELFRTVDGFETADGEPATMFVLANGMLSETPMQTPYTPYQQPGVPMIDPVEPYAQGDFKPSTGEIVATAAVVIAIFTFTVLLQAAGY